MNSAEEAWLARTLDAMGPLTREQEELIVRVLGRPSNGEAEVKKAA